MRPEDLQHVCFPLLQPFSYLYAGLMRLRRFLWEKNIFPRFFPQCPCISIGNIAWGGTGKTPLTDWLLHWAAQKKLHTVVLSRGYKAHPPVLPFQVLPEASPAQAGDEPLMLAQAHPEAVILVDPVRRRAGNLAQHRFAPNLFLMDDGFQHLAVHRQCDLVLLRQEDLRSDWGHVLPAGPWREGPSALSRAAALLIKANEAEFAALLPHIEQRITPLRRPLFSFTLKPEALTPVFQTQGAFPAHSPYLLLCGVGNPAQVAATAETFCGVPPAKTLVYPDHHAYTKQEAAQWLKQALPIVCTQKDAVKLRMLPDLQDRLWFLNISVCFGPAFGSDLSFPLWLDQQFTKQMSPFSQPAKK